MPVRAKGGKGGQKYGVQKGKNARTKYESWLCYQSAKHAQCAKHVTKYRAEPQKHRSTRLGQESFRDVRNINFVREVEH